MREVQSREGIQYVRVQLSAAHDVTRDDWYTTLRGRWENKGEKHPEFFWIMFNLSGLNG